MTHHNYHTILLQGKIHQFEKNTFYKEFTVYITVSHIYDSFLPLSVRSGEYSVPV